MASVLRALFGYCFVVFIMRIVGRRPGKQMTPFEYILIFFIGGLTLTALIGDDRSFLNALTVIMSVGLTHYALARLKQKSPVIGRIIDGTPVVLLENGQRHVESMQSAGIIDDDLMAAARDKGLRSIDNIHYAVLERNGEITIIT
jgi:uncharacterized membrane protein YcaP (DUF421 family)